MLTNKLTVSTVMSGKKFFDPFCLQSNIRRQQSQTGSGDGNQLSLNYLLGLALTHVLNNPGDRLHKPVVSFKRLTSSVASRTPFGDGFCNFRDGFIARPCSFFCSVPHLFAVVRGKILHLVILPITILFQRWFT